MEQVENRFVEILFRCGLDRAAERCRFGDAEKGGVPGGPEQRSANLES